MLSGLKYGAPRWLVEALGKEWSEHEVYTLEAEPGFDHVRTYRGRVVISQPYEASERLGSLLAKLDELGIRARLWGTSPYYPGRTFSIVIWRKEDESFAREIVEKMLEPFANDKSEHPTMEQWT